MADNFGTGQNRVLDVKDRNLDNVVFQYKHPPLTSEWNLINQIGNEKIQNLTKVSYPSGWIHVDDIIQATSSTVATAESNAITGSVICSDSYASTTFKLLSLGNNYAIVNGWPILVQGFGPLSSLEDNMIRLDDSEGEYNNFVFLEVWRKLVSTSDPVYRYGNIDRPYTDNEIEWDVVGCETTKRVQIQYRIRSVKVSSLLDVTKEIFDSNTISPIGGRTTEAVLSSFGKYGASDPGLYVAGDGSETSMEYLNTVDGYVYAIPMFIVYRRNYNINGFLPTNMVNTLVSKELYNSGAGYRSDRPDNKLLDVIYKDDIIDLRHQVMASNDIKNVVDITISKLLSGNLTTALKKASAEDGLTSNAYSGASTIMKVERLNSPGGDNIPDVGEGSLTTSNVFKRRAFCNAEITLDHNVIEITTTGSWVEETFTIASKVTLPAGEIISVDGFYSPDQGLVTGVSSDGTNITIADSGSYPIYGTSNRLFMEFTFKYNSSSYGYKDVPKEFIEVNKNGSVAIATRDHDVLFKYNNSGELLDFSASSGETGYAGDISSSDNVHYCGGNYIDHSNFGHELVITRTAVNGIVNLSLSNYKYNQYYILGIRSVQYGATLEVFNLNLTSSACIVNIPALSAVASASVTIRLYTGSGFNPYSVGESFKFFEMSKQGRGLIDTYEMIMVSASLDSGKYVIDTTDKPIIKIATTTVESGGYLEGTPFVFNSSGDMVHISSTVNDSLPILSDSDYSDDLLPTKINLDLSGLGIVGDVLVPVLVHSYVSSTEDPYNIYYKTVPYQGMLNTTSSSIYGKVISECPAVVSSSGSGAIVNYTYIDGKAVFTYGSREVSGIDTEWNAYIEVGDYIKKNGDSYYYRIIEKDSDGIIYISEAYKGTSSFVTGDDYEIIRMDIPDSMISNVVDRLPALSIVSTTDITDYTCYSDAMEMASDYGDTIMTSVKRKLQDPLNALTNDFYLGMSVAKRGRYDFQMDPAGSNPLFKVGNGRPYLIYSEISDMPTGHNKKVYQFYLFVRSGKGYQANSDLMGKVYLMVVAGETESPTENIISPFFNRDVVDIFELVGRPIIRG